MSQICKIVVKVGHIDDARQACLALGWTMNEKGKLRWYQTQEGEQMDWTIEFSDQEENRHGQKLASKYNIGLLRQADGSYELRHDNAMNGSEVPGEMTMDDTTCRVIGQFKQAVAKANFMRQLAREGFSTTQRVMADGTVHIMGRR